jgi:two-component system CheB/CheR fusion protein
VTKPRKTPTATGAGDASAIGEALRPHPGPPREDSTEEVRALAALGRAKDLYLNKVAHDLRTRLGAILIWLAVMRQSSGDKEKTAHGMDVIEESAHKLAELLDELQDVMNILSGRLDLDPRPLRLESVIEAAERELRPKAEEKKIRVEKLIGPETHVVSGDASRLQQALEALLSNAIKFTPEGGRISIRMEVTGAHARLSVIDHGMGISAELLPHVFARAPRPEIIARSQGAKPGLGLAIAHELVRLHGGTIEASSPGPGKGSSFTLTIPLRKTSAPAS